MSTSPRFTPRPSITALYETRIDPNEVQTYNVKEVARMFGVGQETLRRAIREGTAPVPFHKICGRYVASKRAVHAALGAE